MVIIFLYLISFSYLKGIHWSLHVICSLHKFTIIIIIITCLQGLMPCGQLPTQYKCPAPFLWSFWVLFSSWLIFHSSVCESRCDHCSNMLYPYIVTVVDLYQNSLCFKFFHNIFISFVVKVCVFYGFPKYFCLCCCDSGFAFFF